MRLWHYQLLPYLPDAQFKGQLRELIVIMRAWRDTGKTNHLLINRVMEYDKSELTRYFLEYEKVYYLRFGKELLKYRNEFLRFCGADASKKAFMTETWHNKEYLRVCMANLYEKHHFGVGKSRISDEEWQRLLDGYKNICGEDWVL